MTFLMSRPACSPLCFQLVNRHHFQSRRKSQLLGGTCKAFWISSRLPLKAFSSPPPTHPLPGLLSIHSVNDLQLLEQAALPSSPPGHCRGRGLHRTIFILNPHFHAPLGPNSLDFSEMDEVLLLPLGPSCGRSPLSCLCHNTLQVPPEQWTRLSPIFTQKSVLFTRFAE